MRTVVVALKLTTSVPFIKDADYVGIDRGALTLVEGKIPVTLALGDFDSVNKEEFQLIKNHAKEVIFLNPIKDDTDSESAVRHLLERGYEKIILLGAMGGRMDHSFVNLRLAYQFPQIVALEDEMNLVEGYGIGTYRFTNEKYKYFSFFTEEEAVVSIKGMKYPLDHQKITQRDLYTLSNEILDKEGILIVHSGNVLVIQSKD